MTLENLLGSLEGLIALGLLFGLVLGAAVAKSKGPGCFILLVVPVATLAYVYWWQGQHLSELRSTSALDFVFAPLWSSSGAVAGFFAGVWLRTLVGRRD